MYVHISLYVCMYAYIYIYIYIYTHIYICPACEHSSRAACRHGGCIIIISSMFHIINIICYD